MGKINFPFCMSSTLGFMSMKPLLGGERLLTAKARIAIIHAGQEGVDELASTMMKFIMSFYLS